MSDVSTKACDVCGRLKQEVNHWLVAVAYSTGLTFVPADESSAIDRQVVSVTDICGADCAHKKLSQWLTQQGI